jgi:hypothetical protein
VDVGMCVVHFDVFQTSIFEFFQSWHNKRFLFLAGKFRLFQKIGISGKESSYTQSDFEIFGETTRGYTEQLAFFRIY